jgi:hypothetical protein
MIKKLRNKPNYYLIFLAILILTGSCGCLSREASVNLSKVQPFKTHVEEQNGPYESLPSEIFSTPLGAFRNSWAVLTPNTTYETEYVFYSNAWGPGEVNYTLSGPIISDEAYKDWNISIQPSTFAAKPNTQYRSRVTMKTGSHSFGEYGLPLMINVTLSNYSTHFCNDTLVLYPGIPPGLYSVSQDSISVKTPVIMKRGEIQNYPVRYVRGKWAGFDDISYEVSPSPLNISISPTIIHVKQGVDIPSLISINIPTSVLAGNYTFNLTVRGASPWLYLHDDEGRMLSAPLDRQQKIIPVEVFVE